ncbi:MAG: NAD(P)H-dependent oxidoreductase subunit E [Bacteroidaceae bacterium]|nr:NAD(P)H-dependent oxidoreductase subunit E [Bacteroidaceae bacterium]
MSCENCKISSPDEARSSIRLRTDALVQRIGRSRECVIPLLQALQAEFSYLPSDALERIYETTDITQAQAISVATFYAQFRMFPYGRHTIRVCCGTACHVKGANTVYDSFRRELNMSDDTITTSDGLYSIEKIACLGCCALAPVVQIDNKIFGHVQAGRVGDVLQEFQDYLAANQSTSSEHPAKEIQGEVRLGMENCCQASGTAEVKIALEEACRELGINIAIKPVSCVGACNQVPLIDVAMPDGSITRYPHIRPDEVKEVLLHHFRPASPFRRWRNALLGRIDSFHSDQTWDNILYQPEEERTRRINNFLEGQLRISTEGYGLMNPLDIDEYVARGGFEALRFSLFPKEKDDFQHQMGDTEREHLSSPSQNFIPKSRSYVIDKVLKSGLRGRGGGGFPTGQKWKMVACEADPLKYVICNGDEGDPGAFMDRILLESYPLRVIEGLLVAAYAVGARRAIFYIRAEYPQAVIRVRKALDLCRQRGYVGDNILGTDFSADVTIFEGAGAFVCGEETALIASIEGRRGFPHLRPPYPSQQGLFGHPTLINNVETLSQVPHIITHDDYAAIGTAGSKGTKVFALAGKVRHGGLIEVPMGTTLRQIVENIGGGMEKGEQLKAVQTGGPSGGCIPAHLCDAAVDFDALTDMGAIMGSGGLVVLSETDCMVDVARYFVNFVSSESCGKCTFCRVGVRRMLDILNRICSGKGTMQDIAQLEELAESIQKAALCGLGKTAPNPVLSTLRHFRHEYEEHVNGICRTGSCKQMVRLTVTDDCIGCTKCARCCPADAIPFEPYKKHTIDTELCTLCGLCIEECDFNAIKYENIRQ